MTMENKGDKLITKSCKEVFSMESSRANFNEVRNSALRDFLCDWRMGAAGILSKSCPRKICKVYRKTSATEALFNQIVGLQPASY